MVLPVDPVSCDLFPNGALHSGVLGGAVCAAGVPENFCLTFWKTGNIITNERVAGLRKSSFLLFVFLFLMMRIVGARSAEQSDIKGVKKSFCPQHHFNFIIAGKKCVADQRKSNLWDQPRIFYAAKEDVRKNGRK